MKQQTVTVATRKSALALAQCRAWTKTLAERFDLEVEELHVTTTGDRIQDRALSQIGGKGLFIKEIEESLLDGSADFAVHSLKDVPAELAPQLILGCIPAREDPRDVVVTREGCRFEELKAGSRVGTSSLRRSVQLRARRPDLEYVPIRGNVDTRLRKCGEGVVDATVLAYAGLRRLNLADRATQILEPSECLPAIGQGALAVEQRADDERIGKLLLAMTDPTTQICVAAERGVMVAVEGSCQVPVAGYAERRGERLWLRALLAEPDGSNLRQDEVEIAWPSVEAEAFDCGRQLGQRLKDQ